MPIRICWPSPVLTSGNVAFTLAAGCDKAGENGVVPGAFDAAIDRVEAAVAAAPPPPSPATAAAIWVKNPELTIWSAFGTADSRCPARRKPTMPPSRLFSSPAICVRSLRACAATESVCDGVRL